MISDFQILGIQETDDLQIIKSAYRKRVKETHPDNSSGEDAFRNHLLFIQINQAYRRLMQGRGTAETGRTAAPSADAEGGASLVRHKDPAYVFYRTGMRHFMRIHPSQWSRQKSPFDGNKLPMNAEEREDRRRIVMELMKLFPKAYYYFSVVVHEFPDSPWSADSIEKMRMIEERTRTYVKILESFNAWPSVAKEKARKLESTVARTEEILKGEARPLRWPEG